MSSVSSWARDASVPATPGRHPAEASDERRREERVVNLPGTKVVAGDVDRMIGKLWILDGDDRRSKSSAFWVLLVLAAVIASAGVVSDSTATVIGAMIVAPLMTPILGSALALVLARRRQLLVNAAIVIGGAVVVIVVGYLIGVLHQLPIDADNNSQVAGRVSPRLIDLLAALATGAVGAFALVRSDISDTLPGVAIAISLVPPLAVVGITLESGVPDQAAGALLLFGTNVAAIIATGTVVLLAFNVRDVAGAGGFEVGRMTGRTLAAVAAMVVLVAVPLTVGSVSVYRQQVVVTQAAPIARSWARSQGWQIHDVTYQQGALQIEALGPPPGIDRQTLRTALDDGGLADVDVRVTLVIGGSRTLPGSAAGPGG
jgi:uncharacterized hydrophobic protein (TIGR00271 family)